MTQPPHAVSPDLLEGRVATARPAERTPMESLYPVSIEETDVEVPTASSGPRWLLVFAIVALVLGAVMVFASVVMLLTGFVLLA